MPTAVPQGGETGHRRRAGGAGGAGAGTGGGSTASGRAEGPTWSPPRRAGTGAVLAGHWNPIRSRPGLLSHSWCLRDGAPDPPPSPSRPFGPRHATPGGPTPPSPPRPLRTWPGPRPCAASQGALGERISHEKGSGGRGTIGQFGRGHQGHGTIRCPGILLGRHRVWERECVEPLLIGPVWERLQV